MKRKLAVSILALLLALALLILTACSDNTMVSNSEPPAAAQDATEAATSSPTKNESLSYEIGAVKVISNTIEYEPYVHFASAGVISDGQMTDGVGMYLSFEDISKSLPEIQYDDSFQVLVDGTDAEAPTYSLYNDTFENLYDNQDDFTIPSEAGIYLFCVNVTWSNGATDPSRKEYTLNQYIFKLNISASTLDDNGVLSSIPNPSSALALEAESTVDADSGEAPYIEVLTTFFTNYYNTFVTLNPQDFESIMENNDNTAFMENMLRYYAAKYRTDNYWLSDYSFTITISDKRETAEGTGISFSCQANLTDKDGHKSGERLDYFAELIEDKGISKIRSIQLVSKGPSFYNHFLDLIGQDHSDVQSRTDDLIMNEFID